MDPVDKLLADLKATQQPADPPVAKPLAPPDRPAASMDDLLSQLGEDTKRSVRSGLSQDSPPLKPAVRPSKPWSPDNNPPLPNPRSPEDALLSQLKSHYDTHDRLAEQQRQQELQAAEQRRHLQERDKQRRLEQLRQQRRAELAQQAEAWLKQLSPRTEEGLWFEEFACGYESRLEAAIDYLEALQEAKRG